MTGAATSTTGPASRPVTRRPSAADSRDGGAFTRHRSTLGGSIGLDAHDAGAGTGVLGAGNDATQPAQLSLTGHRAHGAHRAADEARATGELGTALAATFPPQVMPSDQPGIDTGHRVGRMSGDFGIDDDDRRAEHDVADLPGRRRAEALDGECPPHRNDWDPGLVSRLDQRVRVDAVGLALVGRELRRPSQHAGDRVRIKPLTSICP